MKRILYCLVCLILLSGTGCGSKQNDVIMPDNPAPPPKGLSDQPGGGNLRE